jgi:hypothetical protein
METLTHSLSHPIVDKASQSTFECSLLNTRSQRTQDIWRELDAKGCNKLQKRTEEAENL